MLLGGVIDDDEPCYDEMMLFCCCCDSSYGVLVLLVVVLLVLVVLGLLQLRAYAADFMRQSVVVVVGYLGSFVILPLERVWSCKKQSILVRTPSVLSTDSYICK